jgi:uncharacterized SAM-binding protein YcdF (DUF218 family)
MIRFWLLKTIGGPGSLRFLFLGTGVAVFLLAFRRTRRTGRWLLWSFLSLYFVLSLPVVARFLAGPAARTHSLPAAEYGHLDDLFVIDGDNYQSRAALAAVVARTASPRTVWVVGGGELRDAMLAHGIDKDVWRWGGGDAGTTYDQMVWIKKSIATTQSRRAAVIASRVHLPRIVELARRLPVEVVAIPSPLDSEPPDSGVWAWLPSFAGLHLSREGLYERVAVAYYRWKGWQ